MPILTRFKKTTDKPFPDKLLRRVKKIPTTDLSMWADNALTDIGRCLSQYERTRELSWLTEALTGAEALNAVISELHDRSVV